MYIKAIILIICLFFTQILLADLRQPDSFLDEGLSTKALSLGSSYVGVQDDANNVVFNPAILGPLKNSQIIVDYNQNIYLNTSEFLVGYADMLNYDFNFSAILLHAGSGSTEGYDPSFNDTGSPLDSTETIGILSLGTPLINRLSAGISLKVLNEDLGGYSSTGAGLDLGLYWNRLPLIKHSLAEVILDNLEFGLVFKNLLGPNIQFRSDEEQEPTEIRAGLGYCFDLIKNTSFLLTTEGIYDQYTQNVNAVFGAELLLFNCVGLRGGYGDQMARFGLGVTIKKLEFNFAYVDNKDTGVTYNIGITIKLKNLIEPKAENSYQQGLEEYKNNQYEQAIKDLDLALELAPERGYIQDKIKEIRQKENEIKAEKNNELNKNIQEIIKNLPVEEKEEVELLYYEGLDKYYKGALPQALSLWQKIETKDTELQELLKNLMEKVKLEQGN